MPQAVRGDSDSWKAADDVEIVSFSQEAGEPVQLGGNLWGKVYAGRMRFKDGSVHRVAIKRFEIKRFEFKPMTDEKAEEYQDAIDGLRAAGVSLPKMGMVKLRKGTVFGREALQEDEWVQVSQLFGSAGGSKLTGAERLVDLTDAQRVEAAQNLAKVANAGYLVPKDLFGFLESGAPVPFDIDLIVMHGRHPPRQRAESLSEAVYSLSLGVEERRRMLMEAAMKAASDEVRAEFRR